MIRWYFLVYVIITFFLASFSPFVVRAADIDALIDNAYFALDRGDLGNASRLFESALSELDRRKDSGSAALEEVITSLSVIYRAQGRSGEAEPLLERRLRIAERIHGLADPMLTEALIDLAEAYQEQGKYLESAKSYQRLGQIWMEISGEQAEEFKEAVAGLANTFEAQGRKAEAAALRRGDPSSLNRHFPRVRGGEGINPSATEEGKPIAIKPWKPPASEMGPMTREGPPPNSRSLEPKCQIDIKRPAPTPTSRQCGSNNLSVAEAAERVSNSIKKHCGDVYYGSVEDYVLMAGMALYLPPQVGLPLLATASFAKFTSIAGSCLFSAAIETLDISPHLKKGIIDAGASVSKLLSLKGLAGSVANLSNISPQDMWETVALMQRNLPSGLEGFPKAKSSIEAMRNFVLGLPPYEKQAANAWQRAGDGFTGCDLPAADAGLVEAQYLGLLALQGLQGELAHAENEVFCAKQSLNSSFGGEIEYLGLLETYNHYQRKIPELKTRQTAVAELVNRIENQCKTLRRFNTNLDQRKNDYLNARSIIEDALAKRDCKLSDARSALARMRDIDQGVCAQHFPSPHSDVYSARLDHLEDECAKSTAPPIGPSAVTWKLISRKANPLEREEQWDNGQPKSGNYIEHKRTFGLTSHTWEIAWTPSGKPYSRYKFSCSFDQPPEYIVPDRPFKLKVDAAATRLPEDPQGINYGVGYGFEGYVPSHAKCSAMAGKLGRNWIPSANNTCEFVYHESAPDEFVIFAYGSGYGPVAEWRYKRQEMGAN